MTGDNPQQEAGTTDPEVGLLSNITQRQVQQAHRWQFFHSWSLWSAANAFIGDGLFSYLTIHAPKAIKWMAEHFPVPVLVLMPPVMSALLGLLKAYLILKRSGYTDAETQVDLNKNIKLDKQGVITFTGVWAAINLPDMATPLIAALYTPESAGAFASWVQPGIAPIIKSLIGLVAAKAALACCSKGTAEATTAPPAQLTTIQSTT